MKQRSFSKRRADRATSCKQLDFGWSLNSRGSEIHRVEEGETVCSTTGRRSLKLHEKKDRLFVPLATDPFNWFAYGPKRWELRRLGGQFTPRHVRVGRTVELRRGYRIDESLWGKITDVVEAENVEDFFDKVPYWEVIPIAETRHDAVGIATKILQATSGTRLLGFAVGQKMRKLPLSAELVPWVISGRKTSTVRLGKRDYRPGAALIVSRDVEIPVEITEVRHTTVDHLDETTARSEGYNRVADLIIALKKFYPEISDHHVVTVVRFRQE
jgi:uncharacterized protein YqfB (UPF0267 family)